MVLVVAVLANTLAVFYSMSIWFWPRGELAINADPLAGDN
jgi:hypothetical protein